jgi:ribosomal protein S18 acetylase RimI-like enzyme
MDFTGKHRHIARADFPLFMTPPSDKPIDFRPLPIALRPEQPDDEAFLFEVYASTRREELALTNWTLEMKTAFVQGQFKAMRAGYADMFPAAQFLIIMLGPQRIGRMVVNRSTRDVHVVDMVLLPEFCGQGIGWQLMNDIITEAAAAAKTVSLHVLKMNRALRFYQRFGFAKIGDEGPYDKMEWRPPA